MNNTYTISFVNSQLNERTLELCEKYFSINIKKINSNYFVGFSKSYKCVVDISKFRINAIFSENSTLSNFKDFEERAIQFLNTLSSNNCYIVQKNFNENQSKIVNCG